MITDISFYCQKTFRQKANCADMATQATNGSEVTQEWGQSTIRQQTAFFILNCSSAIFHLKSNPNYKWAHHSNYIKFVILSPSSFLLTSLFDI